MATGSSGYTSVMLLFAALAEAVSSSWLPTCSARDAASVWFAFEGAPPAKDAPAPPDFVCPGSFLEDVVCGNLVGVGKIGTTGTNSLGQAQHELRYLPYGDTSAVFGFLNKEGGGVLFKPIYTPAVPSIDDPPPDPAELLRQYLIKRHQASQPTSGITLHTWTCPAATFTPPTEEIEPHGMKHRAHSARAPA